MTGYSEEELMGKDPAFILADQQSVERVSEKNEIRKQNEFFKSKQNPATFLRNP